MHQLTHQDEAKEEKPIASWKKTSSLDNLKPNMCAARPQLPSRLLKNPQRLKTKMLQQCDRMRFQSFDKALMSIVYKRLTRKPCDVGIRRQHKDLFAGVWYVYVDGNTATVCIKNSKKSKKTAGQRRKEQILCAARRQDTVAKSVLQELEDKGTSYAKKESE